MEPPDAVDVVDTLQARGVGVRVDPTLVRSGQWWDHKIPPIIAAAALTLTAAPSLDGVVVAGNLILFLAATIGIAAFGHVVNDLADVRTDELAGAPNQMAPLSMGARTAVLGAAVLVGGVPWIWLPHSARVLALVGIEVGLLTLYSVRPVRLKDRSGAGVLADALYAYVVPILLAIAVFTELTGSDAPGPTIILPVVTWMLLMGLRGILWHQIGDLAHDRRAGVRTMATRIGAMKAEHILGWMVVAELTAATIALFTIAWSSDSPWLPAFGCAYLLYRWFQVTVLWTEPLHLTTLKHSNGRVRFIGFVLLNEFLERWLPVGALVALAIKVPVGWVVLLTYLLLFDNAVFEFFRKDIEAIPDAMNRLAHELKARRNIRAVADNRRRGQRQGPSPLDPEDRQSRRWVFVVCGPDLHVLTLATAIRNLRPLTELEIWVLTDSARNVRPIDTTGIDRIIDVTTPAHLDDHQASIWLKTGIHHHLPSGEWCYLDSDMIAIRPGIEAVFDQPRDVVAFASDLPISANCVDRFSPWAMTCECSGHGAKHSCGHLRDQLTERFGLDVPGDWVHWNGGLFRFGDDSSEFLDLWHDAAVDSFEWPEWRTRDQGALIATVWRLGCQDSPRLSPEFNFIADLGNSDLCLEPNRGWALHPSGPWYKPYLLHLHTSRLEDPEWDLGRDMESPMVRQTLVRLHRWRRFEMRQRVSDEYQEAKRFWARQRQRIAEPTKRSFWATKERLGIYVIRLRHLPTRLRLARIRASMDRRLGRGRRVDNT